MWFLLKRSSKEQILYTHPTRTNNSSLYLLSPELFYDMPDSISSGRLRTQDLSDGKGITMLHVEGDDRNPTMSSDEQFVESFSDKERQKLLRKLDWHIIPCLISLYCMFHPMKHVFLEALTWM